jgi:2-amino-4-hydroxy-6-hydroxymethyldihydropteridine diphosphokinase
MNTVIIGIGSNIGPEENILSAINKLGEFATVVKVSELVRTEPIGIRNQPDFLNGAVKITTSLSKEDLVNVLKEIENRLGRDRSLPKYGPRTIDLDIIVWNGDITDTEYFNRNFLRQSVNEIL